MVCIAGVALYQEHVVGSEAPSGGAAKKIRIESWDQ
jgi:hypothetical protein